MRASIRLVVTFLALVSLHALADAPEVRHGQELIAAMVGPSAAGIVPGIVSGGSALPGQTVRDATKAGFIRNVPETRVYDGFEVAGPHLLIEGTTFSGPLDISAKQAVVLRGVTVRIDGAAYWGVLSRPGAGPLYVLWSRIEGGARDPKSGAGVQRGLDLESSKAVVYRSHVTGTADGIQVHAPGARIIESLVDGLVTWPGEHNDGIQVIGRGEALTVRRSRIVNPHPQTSAILLQRGGHVIEDSYLSGGGWTLYGGATPKPPDIGAAAGVRVTGNIFGQERSAQSGTFGPVADWNGVPATGNVWRDNRIEDGHPVQPPVPPSR